MSEELDPQELVRDFRAWWGDASQERQRIFSPDRVVVITSEFVAANPRWEGVPRLASMIWVINEGGWGRTHELVRWVTLSKSATLRLEG